MLAAQGVQGLGFGVQGLGSSRLMLKEQGCQAFRVQGIGFWVQSTSAGSQDLRLHAFLGGWLFLWVAVRSDWVALAQWLKP